MQRLLLDIHSLLKLHHFVQPDPSILDMFVELELETGKDLELSSMDHIVKMSIYLTMMVIVIVAVTVMRLL